MAPLLRIKTAQRGFAFNVVERRSPQAGLYSDWLVESGAVHSASTPVSFERRDTIYSPSGEPVASTPSLTVSNQAMAGIIVVLGIVVLGVAGLRLRKFLRNRGPKARKSPKLKPLSLCESPLPEKILSEKRNPMYTQTLLDFGYDGLQPPSKARTQYEKPMSVYSDSEAQYTGWAPQIRSWPADPKGETSPDLLPRPFIVPSPPAPAATRWSHFSRIAARFTRSPKPSVLSFDIEVAPPYSSTAPTPRTMTPIAGSSPLASVPNLNSSSSSGASPSPEAKSAAPVKKQKTPHNLLPIRADAPRTKLPRVPVPNSDSAPLPVITIAEVTQTILMEPVSDGTYVGGPMKSPSRLDSARLDKSSTLEGRVQTPRMIESFAGKRRDSSSSSKHVSSDAKSMPSSEERESRLGISGKKIPRLVVVVNPFTPSMDDELQIRLGEVVRLTHEFHDGWCSVERIGADAEKGVVPLFCVTERASFVPNRTKSQSLINATQNPFTGSISSSSTKTSSVSSSSTTF